MGQSAKLHYMTESATRQKRLRAITRTALRLADEHGLDGFTMDQLAEEVGVSRRTLFNYVPGKIDAVLGPEPEVDEQLVEAFLAGGPTGQLMEDLRLLTVSILDDGEVEHEDMVRFRRLLHGDARILQAAHARFQGSLDEKVEFLQQREGRDFPATKARLAIQLTVVVFDTALDAFLDEPGTTLADHFTQIFDQLTELV